MQFQPVVDGARIDVYILSVRTWRRVFKSLGFVRKAAANGDLQSLAASERRFI